MIRRWLGCIALSLWFLLEIDALPVQLQLAVLEGQILIPSVVFKALLLVTLVSGILLARGRLLPPFLMLSWWIFVTYLVAHTLYLAVYLLYPSDYIAATYNSYYFWLIIIPLAFALRGVVSPRTAALWLVVLFVPLAILGLAQAISGDPIVPTESAGDYLTLNAWIFEGETRAFSLFTSGVEFGHYIALVGALAVTFLLGPSKRVKLVGLALIVLVMATAISTLTRATYLEVAMAMFAAFLLLKFRGPIMSKLLVFLPVFYGLMALFIAFLLAPIIVAVRPSGILFSSDSMLIRYQEWAQTLPTLLEDNIITTLFGTGLIQNERFLISGLFQFDNAVLAVWMHSGLIGVLVWFALMWNLWRYVFSASNLHNSYLAVAVAASWSTWISTGVFNTAGISVHAAFLVLLLFALGGETRTVTAEVSKGRVRRAIPKRRSYLSFRK